MIIQPIECSLADLGIGISTLPRSEGLHMSEIYGKLFQRLEPKRFDPSRPMDPLRLELGLEFETLLEDVLKSRLTNVGERPGEFTTEEGIIFSPDLIIYNGTTRLGEIKLTWMSCRELPLERIESGFPPKFDKWFVQMMAYCVAPHTRLLTSDLRWLPAQDIHVGDRLLAFDEFPTTANNRRAWKHTTVTKRSVLTRSSYLLQFENGDSLECSADHQWLAVYQEQIVWVQTQFLTSAYRVCKPLDPWIPDASYGGGYIAGVYDGEGSLSQHGSLSGKRETQGLVLDVAQKDNEVFSQLQQFLRDRDFRFSVVPKNFQGVCRLKSTRFTDILTFLGRYRPQRLLDKFESFSRFPATGFARTIGVSAVVPLGQRSVVALETDAHTFIAEGYASHNCKHLDLREARLFGFFVCGEWNRSTGNQPQFRAWDIEFSKREIDDNWRMLVNFARKEGMLK